MWLRAKRASKPGAPVAGRVVDVAEVLECEIGHVKKSMPGGGARRRGGGSVAAWENERSTHQGHSAGPTCNTTDQDGAKAFYGGLFGWELDDKPVGDGVVYSMAKLDGKLRRRRSRRSPSSSATPACRRSWNSYVTVENADETARQGRASSAPPSTPTPFDVMDAGPHGRDPGSPGRLLPGLAAQAAHRRRAGQRARRAVLERARLARPRRLGRASTASCSAGPPRRWRAPTRPTW